MSIKAKKAVRATSNSINANPHGKYTLGGRVYNSEKYAGPLEPRKDVTAYLRRNEKVSAADIFNIERMLQGNSPTNILPEERKVIIAKYNLIYENHRWVSDPVTVFEQICKEYPQAAKYNNYAGLLYAMKYGDTPCEITRVYKD